MLGGGETTADSVVSTMRVDESIVFAALYDGEGKEVARYQSAQYAGKALTVPDIEQSNFTEDGFLDVVEVFDLVNREASGKSGKVYLRVSTQRLGELCDFHEDLGGGRNHLGAIWSKDHVHAAGRALREICVQVSRIAAQVFGVVELRGVDED